MDEKMPKFELPAGSHPFLKLFGQIQEILSLLEKGKTQGVGQLPPWLLPELEHVEGSFTQFKALAEKSLPEIPDMDDAKLKKMLLELPEAQRKMFKELITQGRKLKNRTKQLQDDWFKLDKKQEDHITFAASDEELPLNEKESACSPMNLLSKEKEQLTQKDQREEQIKAKVERRKRFGKMGGRKHWRPM